MSGGPRVSVVVPSHDRPLRLRWLLEALAEQTLPREAFEVVVVHDSRGDETDRLLATHRLGVRASRLAPCGPARKRNHGWRQAAAPLVAFTDDDCRPEPEWLERLLAAAEAHPGAVVQGPVVVDEAERPVFERAPWARSQQVTVPSDLGQTANILYPTAAVEAAGGFDEALPVAAGEDTDLLIRVRAAGAPLVPVQDAVVRHAVFDLSLRARVREAFRWMHLAAIVRRHPQLRSHLFLGVFWKEDHAWWLLGAAGLATRRPWLAMFWLERRLLAYGKRPRGLARAAAEAPGQVLIDGAEVVSAVRGSARYRTLFL